MTVYKTETIEYNDKAYLVEWVYDEHCGPPWENSDGHGVVSDWVTRDKKPGELVLAEGRGRRRYYDLAATMKIAKRDGWNAEPYEWPTKNEQAHAAVMADYEYLRRWCNDEWHYCGIVVTKLVDGCKAESASIFGVESDADDYHKEIIKELIDELSGN